MPWQAWERVYRSKLCSADEAVSLIRSGQRIYVGGGAGYPQELIRALVRRAPELEDVELVHILTLGEAPTAAPGMEKHFRHNALFVGHNVRKAVQEGRADATPIFLFEVPRLFLSGQMPLDVALIQVGPPDEHGFCSFGVEVGCTKPAAEAARLVIAEVNRQMPRVLGDSFIHVSRLDRIVEVDYPIPEFPQGGSSPVHERIADFIADMIPDGATLQTGIGSIPDAVLRKLRDKRDLGVHTELFSDGVIDLVEAGVITNARKTFHPGKIVAGFLFGSKRLYEFVHDNPIVELHPTHYVNDPFNIARNERMVAINSAIEVDLTGQVCADSIGPRIYSGFGGQLDFIRGAAYSKGGIPIIALPSTAKGETISRIVPQLKPGAGVVTTRADVHYVVTEYGVAYLHGKSLRERAKALIRIAHPKFREELERYAKEVGYL